MIELYNEDCIPALQSMGDNQFDLAIVDPPYGIGESGGKNRRAASKHIKKTWDQKTPSKDYFNQLFRVSKNQIIWGANYFNIYLPGSMGYICWDKKLYNSDFSDFELAYTSFKRAAKIFKYSKNGGSRKPHALADIIHPTQKPIKLYEWLLTNYAKPDDTILDTHLGSGSIAIACHNLKFNLTAYEIDKDYFDAASKRLEEYKKQMVLF